MSRIIIKNIPNGFDEAKLRNHFSTCGIVTDVQLKYTPEGKFRNFGFIGYENEEQASSAITHFNNSFIRTSKITVAPCVVLNESRNLKVWSKHTQKPTEPSSIPDESITLNAKEKHKAHKAKDVLEHYQDDPKFKEFLDAHKQAGKLVWDNQFQHTSASGEETTASKITTVKTDIPVGKDDNSKSKKTSSKPWLTLFVAKMHNIPVSTKRQNILHFFKTSKPHSVRIPTKQKGFAYVGFKTETELNKALLMDKSFLGGKQVRVLNFTARSEKPAVTATNNNQRKQAKWERQKGNKSSESICESGKLFFRNLAYSVQEEDIRALFEKYGPVVEVDVPIDPNTRKIKGFGTATFLMPEHAVMAYNELNGSFLQGRMFHILPAIVQNDVENEEQSVGDSSYKKKKEREIQKTAQSSHNWNTLFMGENAVAEAVAKKYGTTKEDIMFSEGETSAAVRLALGETELVLEMQNFLKENGISLVAFDTKEAVRSNTVILAKNLAPGCTTNALRTLFSPFGILGRVVLPPSAVTAVVEFLDPSEARKAFKKLAYTQFQSLPLFLEWAPKDTFSTPPPQPVADTKEVKPGKEQLASNPHSENQHELSAIADELDDTTYPEEGTTLFIKNLSFSTNEDAIRERFRNVGTIHSVQVMRKMAMSGSGRSESCGYGFIQFKQRHAADYALKNLQFTQIDGRTIELARSHRTLHTAASDDGRKRTKSQKQTGSKILVRNIPFQASGKEVHDLFKPFGDIKSLRLPKKMAPGADESHRGFCFVEFEREPDAKRAFETLGKSTHLYGRRLVLEWAAPEDGVDELRKRTAEQFSTIEGSSGKRTHLHKGELQTEQFISAAGPGNDDDDEDDEDGDTF